QDKVPVLSNQIINPDLIFIQDNNSLTYFDEFITESFIQYNYRTHKNIAFSNPVSPKITPNHSYKELYVSRQSKFLLLQETDQSGSIKNHKIIYQNSNENSAGYDIPQLNHYFWNEKTFFWILDDDLYSYDFENEPKKVKLPQRGENYYIFNRQLFLWKSKVMYLYKLEIEN
ncbi:MAG: hypothetical protein LBQ84_05845, partial [Flavobacteriaceae bacterium]|nr:hypothetical protein [Flavobacteriaceae bacterium]